MVKSEKRPYNYTYGNTAYELQPEVIHKKKKKTARKPNKHLKIRRRMVLTVVAIAIISIITLTRFSAIINLQGSIRVAKTEIAKVQKENENIQVEIAQLNNTKKIEEVAVADYKMIYPENKDVIFVDVKPLTVAVADKKITALQFVERLLGLIY